jgi:hypothetical protein
MERSTSLIQSTSMTRNIVRVGDLVPRGPIEVSPNGTRQTPDNIEIDYKTSRSICDEVGERLQQDLRLEDSRLPPYLLHRLIDECASGTTDRLSLANRGRRNSSSRGAAWRYAGSQPGPSANAGRTA